MRIQTFMIPTFLLEKYLNLCVCQPKIMPSFEGSISRSNFQERRGNVGFVLRLDIVRLAEQKLNRSTS